VTRCREKWSDQVTAKNCAIAKRDLSSQQLEVGERLALGNSTQQIADQMGLCLDTIITHKKRLFKKLGVQSETEAIHRLHQLGLIPQSEE